MYISEIDIHDVLHVSARYQVDREPREIYFFREGSVVFWNVSEVERKDILSHIKPFEDGPYAKPVILEGSEKMLYTYTQVLYEKISLFIIYFTCMLKDFIFFLETKQP